MDLSDFITHYHHRMDFDRTRQGQLTEITTNIYYAGIYILLPILAIHMLICLLILMKDQVFRRQQLHQKCVYIIANIYLVLPVKDEKETCSRSERLFFRYLLLLHLLEHIVILIAAKFMFFEFEMSKIFSFPYLYFEICFLIPIIICNLISLGLVEYYYRKHGAWFFLPKSRPQMPENMKMYGPKVIQKD